LDTAGYGQLTISKSLSITVTPGVNRVSVTGTGGQILSRGNNTLENNGNGTTFPGTYSAK
jgi:hypothetical protein